MEIDFDTWTDRIGFSDLDEYLIELNQEDPHYFCSPEEQDQWLSDAYDDFISDMQDQAYQKYKDDKYEL